MEEKLTHEQLEREALKLKLQLDKSASFLKELGNCNGYSMSSDAIKSMWVKIINENEKLLQETPIKL